MLHICFVYSLLDISHQLINIKGYKVSIYYLIYTIQCLDGVLEIQENTRYTLVSL